MTSTRQQAARATRQPMAGENNGYPPDAIDPHLMLAFRTLMALHDVAPSTDIPLNRSNDSELALARLALTRLQHDDGSSVA